MPGANASDFFGEGTTDSVRGADTPKRDWVAQPPRSEAEWDLMMRETGGNPDPVFQEDTRSAEQKAVDAYNRGNFGATAGYAAGNDATRAAYDQYHENTRNWAQRYADNSGIDLNPFNNPLGGGPPHLRNRAGGSVANTTPGANGPVVGAGGVPTMPEPPPPPGSQTPANGQPGTGFGGAPAGAPGATGAGANRENIDPLLDGLDTYRNDIYALSQDNTGLSVAEAQLAKATALANRQSAINTEASQRSALGAARSVRNRGDRALAERQAIGESTYVGQEAARTDALRQATAAGDLSILRATESNYDREFKLKALQAASDVGLNTAALEVDLAKVNLADAAERMKIALGYAELDQAKARDLMSYARDMAAIQFQYDQLSVEDQNEADRLLMQKYGIDEGTKLALEQLRANQGVNWGQVLTSFVGGAGAGATGALAKSDIRAKTNIQEVESTAGEFEELMGALTANTYEYIDPKQDGYGLRFGFMAQDLEKTKLGKHMVKPDAGGFKTVDIAPLALATASGLGLVYERIKDLEKAVRS